MKRGFDLLVTAILSLALLPFVLILVVVYVISGNWSVLFKQQRLGLHEVSFTLLKFRTLSTDDNLPIEERSFALGSWLRRTSLDELPQLINVIKGEMSLVGPRPLPVEYEPFFSTEQRKRFLVRPGITGLAQVNGGTRLSWTEKFDYDLQYVQNRSFFGDIKVLLETILVVLRKKDDGLQEKPFTGN